MRRTGWLAVFSMLAGLLYAVVFDHERAWALDPLTPVPPPAALAPPNVIGTVGAAGPTNVSGRISIDTVWGPQGSPYVVTAGLIVEDGVTLTLLPGTVVKLLGDNGGIDVWGQLLVLGMPDRRVVFTSLRDDSVLGDTNGDGAATVPAPGDWRKVWLYRSGGTSSKFSGGSLVDQADFRFGGKSTSGCRMAQLDIASGMKGTIVSNSAFSDSANSHIYVSQLGSDRNRFGLYSNTFSRGQGSACGVRVVTPRGEIVGNTFTDVWLWYDGGNRKSRIWRNYLGGGIYLWVGSVGQPVARENVDVRYNTILSSANDYGRVDWTSNWWGYNVNDPLPLCMTTAAASSHFPPVRLVDDPGGICAGQPGCPTAGFKMNVRAGLSGPPALSPPAAVREAAAPRFGPVDLYSGVLAYQETDFGVEDAGKRLSVTRSFRSDRLSTGDAGPGWTVAYAEGLSPDGAGGSVLNLANGGSLPFASDIAAGYTPAPGVFADYSTGASGSSITTSDDTTYQFNPAGELTAMLLGDPGHQVDVERSAGKVSKVTGVSGRYLSFTRSSGKVTAVSDSTGRGIGLSYVDGRLSAVSGVDGKSRGYQYDSAGRLIRVTSPGGLALFAVEYATDGKVAWLEEAGSGRTVFSYDPANRRTTATLANGDAIVFGYDTLGRLVSQTRGGTSTHIVYDGEGRAVASVAGVPAVAMTGYSASASMSFFDGRNDLVMSMDPTGRREDTTYNVKHRPLVTTRSDGSAITRVYDGNNRLQTVTDPLGKLWQYQFNAHGQVTGQTDPLSRVRTVTYTAGGDVETVTDETSAVTNLRP